MKRLIVARLIVALLIVALTSGCTTVRTTTLRPLPAVPGSPAAGPIEGAIVGLLLRDGTEVSFAEPARLATDGTVSGRIAPSRQLADYPPGTIEHLVLEQSRRKPSWPAIAAVAAATLTVLYVLFRNWVDQFE